MSREADEHRVQKHDVAKSRAANVPRFISKIEFSIGGADSIRRRSVVAVTETVMFENGNPKHGGLLDARMGPYDRKHTCETCYQDVQGCTGHYGSIELTHPAFHPAFMPFVGKLLRCVCFACSKLLCPRERARLLARTCRYNSSLLPRITEYCMKKGARCPHCFVVQPKWTLEEDVWLFMSWPNVPEMGAGDSAKGKGRGKKAAQDQDDDKRQKSEPAYIVLPRKVRSIFRNVEQEDCQLLGLGKNRPEDLILSVLSVPPPNIRPPIVNDSARGSDGITKKYLEIVHYNENLRLYGRGWSQAECYTEFQQMQYHIATVMSSQACGAGKTPQGGRPNQASQMYDQRINGKEGRMRGNIMGKRVDNAARGVISPDPRLHLWEVGFPSAAVTRMVVREDVTPYNLVRLSDLCERGPFKYPGATFVVRAETQEKVDLRFRKSGSGFRLNVGDTVGRHPIDGDVCIFNRQPSLHRMSMMGFLLRVIPGSTFRINLSTTAPFNADFDGDEARIHSDPYSYLFHFFCGGVSVLVRLVDLWTLVIASSVRSRSGATGW